MRKNKSYNAISKKNMGTINYVVLVKTLLVSSAEVGTKENFITNSPQQLIYPFTLNTT